MKLLKEKFVGRGQVKGFTFTQIKKNEFAFLYEVNANGMIHYEVFKRKINKRHNCESYPSNKSFGKWAWTSRDIAKSLDTFIELTLIGQAKKEAQNG